MFVKIISPEDAVPEMKVKLSNLKSKKLLNQLGLIKYVYMKIFFYPEVQ